MGTDPYRFSAENLQASRLELEWKNFGLQMMIDMDLMLEPEFSLSQHGYDFMRDQVRLAMRTKILTDNLPPEKITKSTTVRVEEPASTWQMWKRNNQGKWYTKWWLAKWLEKWPVIMNGHDKTVTMTVNLERFRAYPEAKYRASQMGLGRVRLMHTLSEPWWDNTDPVSEDGE
jgi:hypothetical protein